MTSTPPRPEPQCDLVEQSVVINLGLVNLDPLHAEIGNQRLARHYCCRPQEIHRAPAGLAQRYLLARQWSPSVTDGPQAASTAATGKECPSFSKIRDVE